MAKCLGKTCPYGWGHPREHAEAARVGWRRRHGTEADYLAGSFGDGWQAHRHKDKVVIQHEVDEKRRRARAAHEYREQFGRRRAA